MTYESFEAVDKREPVETDFLFFQNVFGSVFCEKL